MISYVKQKHVGSTYCNFIKNHVDQTTIVFVLIIYVDLTTIDFVTIINVDLTTIDFVTIINVDPTTIDFVIIIYVDLMKNKKSISRQ